MIGIGLVGYGYWGPNLARNFSALADCSLIGICDKNPTKQDAAKKQYPLSFVSGQYDDLLNNSSIDVILISTPVVSHFELAKQALLAGKDVFVEKPLTQTVRQSHELIELAANNNRILAVDHTFLYTGAVQKIKEIIDSGDLGEIKYFDSVRINLGLFQHDVNVIFDLAPHDLSILNYIVDKDPISVQAMGVAHAGNHIESLSYLHLEYPDEMVAHFHLNWLSPVKIRRTLIGGTKKMIVYDDMETTEKVKVYDTGIIIKEHDTDSLYKTIVDYRTGDMIAPKVAHGEALAVEAKDFISCVKNRKTPLSDGLAGLRVMRILEAAQESLHNEGRRIAIGV